MSFINPFLKLPRIFSSDDNPKTSKGMKLGYLTHVMYLAPYTLSGRNVCPFASSGCAEACLNTAGRGQMSSVQQSRLVKTNMYFHARELFMAELKRSMELAVKKSEKLGLRPVFRLNGTSDLPWERMAIMKDYADTQFYDYTKSVKRMKKYLNGDMPANYHLTFSRSESNQSECREVLEAGGNVAVVFHGAELPETYEGFPVINGDTHDLRFTDRHNVVIGLKAKGKAKHDTTGFVVRES